MLALGKIPGLSRSGVPQRSRSAYRIEFGAGTPTFGCSIAGPECPHRWHRTTNFLLSRGRSHTEPREAVPSNTLTSHHMGRLGFAGPLRIGWLARTQVRGDDDNHWHWLHARRPLLRRPTTTARRVGPALGVAPGGTWRDWPVTFPNVFTLVVPVRVEVCQGDRDGGWVGAPTTRNPPNTTTRQNRPG